MKAFILCFNIFMFVYSKEVKKDKIKCEGIHVHGKLHKKEVLSNGINRPYQLSVYNNTVFFSYNVGDINKDTFEIGYVKENQKVPVPINSTKNGFATAIDAENKIVYLGGSDGIYVYDLTGSNNIKHEIKGPNIWDMFFKHHLYFIVYPTQRLHRKKGNNSEIVEHIHEKIYQFVIDGDEDTFIVTRDGLYKIKNGTKERIAYEGPKVFKAIEVNRKGVAHFCSQSEIYIANKEVHKLEVIAHVENIFGLTFDHNDNIIYSDPHEIVKLLPSDCK